ncbi:hypothetical protein HGM15179_022220, partial [Zosterops borbonicus]
VSNPTQVCLGAHLSLLDAGGAVQAQVDVAVEGEEALEDVEHPRHLRENQHPVPPGPEPPQENVQRLQLTWRQVRH